MSKNYRTFRNRLDTDVCLSFVGEMHNIRYFLIISPIGIERQTDNVESATFMSLEDARAKYGKSIAEKKTIWHLTEVTTRSRVVTCTETYNEFTEVAPTDPTPSIELNGWDVVSEAEESFGCNSYTAITDADLATLIHNEIDKQIEEVLPISPSEILNEIRELMHAKRLNLGEAVNASYILITIAEYFQNKKIDYSFKEVGDCTEKLLVVMTNETIEEEGK